MNRTCSRTYRTHSKPLVVVTGCFLWALCCCLPAAGTPLDDYVAAPDPNYTHSPKPVKTIKGRGVEVDVWSMTSQAWRTPQEVDRTLWEHWLTVAVPKKVSYTKALLVVSGGDNGNPAPSSVDDAFVKIAVATNSIVAGLHMIPNQPIKFADEPPDSPYHAKGRVEDEMISYTWDKYKKTGDPTWLARLPMTKAVVRAMDTIQAEYPAVDGFVIVGGSKRGWTTWTTGAIQDPRVIAIVPAVIDVLNLEHSMQHHRDAYGFWAEAVGDYTTMGVMDWLHTPECRSLLAVVDPYSYVDRLTMPKYIINATGDEFFLPDSSQFYFDALKGEKYLRYVPNASHGLDGTDVMESLAAYYMAILNNASRPQFSWTKEPDGSLRVQAVTPPAEVKLWQATNPNARDFRLDIIGPVWAGTVLTDQGSGLYVGQVPEPEKGWTAFFVEMTYATAKDFPPMKFTTEVSVLPHTMPYRKPGGWGSIETVGEGTDAVTLLRVGGDRYQMGYWYGRLLADQIAGAVKCFAGAYTGQQYAEAIDGMWKRAHFDTVAWEAELRGIADGCNDAGRPEITFKRMLQMLMLPDVSEHGCSLFAAWGKATADGHLYQMRNLDWTMESGVQQYPVVTIYEPTDGNAHAVVGFAGMLGVAGGGMNEHGIAESEIMGHFGDPETLDGIPFPVLLRDVLYYDNTLADGLARIQRVTRTNQYHYCLSGPEGEGASARLLFTSNAHYWEFKGGEAVAEHPVVKPTPFHEPLTDVVYWKNHNGSGNIVLHKALKRYYGSINAKKSIEIARAAGVKGTLLSVLYDTTARKFWVAFAEGLEPAHKQGYVEFDLRASGGVGGAGYRTSVGQGTEEIPVVVVSGTPYQMGYQQGRLMKTEMQTFAPDILRRVREGSDDLTNARLDAAWEATAPFTDDRYEQELLGLAAGAETDYLTLRRLACVPMLAEFSCSGIAAWGKATADGHLYQTRNLDWTLQTGAQDYPLIAVYMPDKGNAHANVTFVGIIGSHTGINEAGVVLTVMSYSPAKEKPYDINGVHFLPLLRHILYDADNLAEALDILKNAKRIKRYRYVIACGEGKRGAVKIRAYAPEQPPEDFIVWRDNDPNDEYAPNVLKNVVYNDEGRGAYPLLKAAYGALDHEKLIDVANQIPIRGANVVNVVYDATTLELWAAFANGSEEAYRQPYVHFDLRALDGDGDRVSDLDEGGGDADQDGVPNYLDPDSKGRRKR